MQYKTVVLVNDMAVFLLLISKAPGNFSISKSQLKAKKMQVMFPSVVFTESMF